MKKRIWIDLGHLLDGKERLGTHDSRKSRSFGFDLEPIPVGAEFLQRQLYSCCCRNPFDDPTTNPGAGPFARSSR